MERNFAMSGPFNFQDSPKLLSSPSIVLGEMDGRTDIKEWFQLWKPSEFIDFQPPKDFILAGDCHVTRGGITVLGGAPGVGKSRAALGLAIAGATGKGWMGFPVHSKFKTLVVQAENGPYRLKGELTDISEGITENLDDWLRVTPPPTYGLAFTEPGFRAAIEGIIDEWEPSLIIIDPWNRATQGDKQADAQAALEGLFACLPADPEKKPAILIVHHLRKKSSDHKRKSGRDLLHELAGTYQIGSSARCVFALEPASENTEDDRVVLTCCKNNDGIEGQPSAWHRKNGLFGECEDFDWEAFNAGEIKEQGINLEAIRRVLSGTDWLTRAAAVKRLVDADVCKRSAGFNALVRFESNFEKDQSGKKIRLRKI
ncbi:AAA family ATPase [Akkermansiaceae bacterium]|nr:AAA family ATPase [Akkermansiaceae bacterium]